MQTFMNLPLALVLTLTLPACVRGPAAADTEDTDGTSTTTTTTTTTTTGMCAPEPGDGACMTCVKSQCCAQKQACEANEDCACLLTCLGDDGSPLCEQCTGSPAKVPEIGALLMCMGPSCDAQCG